MVRSPLRSRLSLGRKHIIDKCPSCSRHYVAEADKWQTPNQLEVSGAEEKLRASPTPENAIAVHQQLVNYHQFKEAAAFRQKASAQFPDSAKLQVYFGDSLTHFGELAAALPFYTRALELRPDLPGARAGVADGHTRANRLPEARALLDFLAAPGAAQLYPMAPLERLANAYQQAGRQRGGSSWPCTGNYWLGLPAIADHKNFRAAKVQRSEKLRSRGGIRFCPKGHSAGAGYFSRSAGKSRRRVQLTKAPGGRRGSRARRLGVRHRQRVHPPSPHRASRQRLRPAGMEIAIMAPASGRSSSTSTPPSVFCPEGDYHAVITGPVHQEVDFGVHALYFDRWYEDPAWVLNVGGSTVLVTSTVVYQRDPPPAVGGISASDGPSNISRESPILLPPCRRRSR